MPITLEAGDLLPIAEFTLTRPGGVTFGFSEADVATVEIIAQRGSADPIVLAPVTSWDMNVGETEITGTYEWAVGDTDVPGRYPLKIRVTLDDGRTATFPNDHHRHDELRITPA